MVGVALRGGLTCVSNPHGGVGEEAILRVEARKGEGLVSQGTDNCCA